MEWMDGWLDEQMDPGARLDAIDASIRPTAANDAQGNSRVAVVVSAGAEQNRQPVFWSFRLREIRRCTGFAHFFDSYRLRTLLRSFDSVSTAAHPPCQLQSLQMR